MTIDKLSELPNTELDKFVFIRAHLLQIHRFHTWTFGSPFSGRHVHVLHSQHFCRRSDDVVVPNLTYSLRK